MGATDLELVYETIFSESGRELGRIDVDSAAPRPHRDICDFANKLVDRLNMRARGIAKQLKPYSVSDCLHTTDYRAPRQARQLAAVMRAALSLQNALARPSFRRAGPEQSFSEYVESCIRVMREDLLNRGYVEESAAGRVAEYATRWNRDSADAETAEIFSRRLDDALNSVYGKDGAHRHQVDKPVARAIHYRQHTWPSTSQECLVKDNVNYATEKDLSRLLASARAKKGLWRVIQNVLSAASVLAVEAGTLDANQLPGGKDAKREEQTGFAFAACITPLSVLSPFSLMTDVKSEAYVHRVSSLLALFLPDPKTRSLTVWAIRPHALVSRPGRCMRKTPQRRTWRTRPGSSSRPSLHSR